MSNGRLSGVAAANGTSLSESERQSAYGLRLLWLARSFRLESGAFLSLCLYYVVEYGRLHTIYPALDIFPWGNVALGSAILFWAADKHRQHPINTLVVSAYAFFLLAFLSMTYAIDQERASYIGHLYLGWMIVFFLTVSIVTTERRFALLLILFLLCNFKMSQYGAITWAMRGFAFTGWGVAGPSGWFQNAGELGLQMAMICVISLGYFLGANQYLSGWRRWFIAALPVTSFMTVLASSTRGDYLALAAALCWLPLVAKGRRLAQALLVAAACLFAYLLIPDQMLSRFHAAGEDYTSYTRKTRWAAGLEIFADNPVLGVGTGSWLAYYEEHFPREEGREGWGLPHNSFIEVIGEHGIPGLVLFALIFAGMFMTNRATRTIGIRINDPVLIWLTRGLDAATIAYLVGGSFMSVFWYPYVWVHSAIIVSLNTVAIRRSLTAKLQQSGDAPSPLRQRSGAARRRSPGFIP